MSRYQVEGQLLGVVALRWIGAVIEESRYQRHLLSVTDTTQRRGTVQRRVAPFAALENSNAV